MTRNSWAPSAAVSMPTWERAFCVFVLLLAMAGGTRPFASLLGFGSTGDYVSGDPVAQTLWTGVYSAAVFMVLAHAREASRQIRRGKLLCLFLAFAIVSLAWSPVPEVSLRRCFALLGTSAVGLYLATRCTPRQLFLVLLWTAALAALLSLVMPFFLKEATWSVSEGWRGIFGHKNWLGRSMAFSAVLWLLHAIESRRHRTLATSVVVLSLVLLLLSASKTALVVLIALLALLPLAWGWRLRSGAGVPTLMLLIVACGIAGAWLVSNAGGVLEALGKDATLTGRVPLWMLLVEAGAERPWLGHSYGGFWVGWEGPSANVWAVTDLRGQGWLPPGGHNGFLDLWLDLGTVGLVLFATTFVVNVGRALRLIRKTRSAEGLFPLIFLAFLLLSNITETSLVTHNSLFWIVYWAISLHLVPDGEAFVPRPQAPLSPGVRRRVAAMQPAP